MVSERAKKDDHLIFADAVGSRGKSGVWFGDQKAFKEKQSEVLEMIKDKVDWIPLENAMMAISLEPPGICIIAPNPSLPGIIVLSDGATPENAEAIRKHYIEITRLAIESIGLKPDLDVKDDEGKRDKVCL